MWKSVENGRVKQHSDVLWQEENDRRVRRVLAAAKKSLRARMTRRENGGANTMFPFSRNAIENRSTIPFPFFSFESRIYKSVTTFEVCAKSEISRLISLPNPCYVPCVLLFFHSFFLFSLFLFFSVSSQVNFWSLLVTIWFFASAFLRRARVFLFFFFLCFPVFSSLVKS